MPNKLVSFPRNSAKPVRWTAYTQESAHTRKIAQNNHPRQKEMRIPSLLPHLSESDQQSCEEALRPDY